jgi:hypothetical protein
MTRGVILKRVLLIFVLDKYISKTSKIFLQNLFLTDFQQYLYLGIGRIKTFQTQKRNSIFGHQLFSIKIIDIEVGSFKITLTLVLLKF